MIALFGLNAFCVVFGAGMGWAKLNNVHALVGALREEMREANKDQKEKIDELRNKLHEQELTLALLRHACPLLDEHGAKKVP